MRVLIIGGTGLISTAIVEQLLARGHVVTMLNRGRTRSRLSSTIPVLHCDRRQKTAFRDAVRPLTLDAVIDMAAFTPEETQIAYEAFRGQVRHFVHCSTVCVYGGPLSTLPATEDEPHTPVCEYGLNKSACEAFLRARFQHEGFPVTIIRPSHTYGEGNALMHTLGMDTAYLDRLRRGLPVVVHGDGQSLWAPAHISDVARAFVNVLGNERTIGEAYQVTGDEWMTWNQYYATIAEVLGGRYNPVHIPAVDLRGMAPEETACTYDIHQWPSIFDTGKAKRELGYEYRIRCEDGVRRTLRWLEANGGLRNGEEDRLSNRLIAAWDLARTGAYSAMEIGADGEEDEERALSA